MGCEKFYQGLTDKIVAFAQSEKYLSERQQDGCTRRQHLETAKKCGAKCPDLDQPEVPIQVKYLEYWYCDARTKEPITWTELKAWAELTNRTPNAWEYSTLRAIDRVMT